MSKGGNPLFPKGISAAARSSYRRKPKICRPRQAAQPPISNPAGAGNPLPLSGGGLQYRQGFLGGPPPGETGQVGIALLHQARP